MKKTKFNKWLALPLSLLIAVPVTVQSTIAYIVTQTQAAVNTFKPFDSIEGGLIISKTIEHPYGTGYTIPENIAFDFQVELGALYAGYTVKTSEGEVIADKNGTIVVSVKPDELFGIEGIDEGMEVTVTELETGAGFTAKSEVTQYATISPDDFVTVDYVNVYTPEPADASILLMRGEKTLQGRDWQEGDEFTFLLECKNPDGTWNEVAAKTVAYSADDENFNRFDYNDALQSLQLDQLGTYTLRMREAAGSIEGITYDTTEYTIDVHVTDNTMDGTMDVKGHTNNNFKMSVQSDGRYEARASFTNVYAEQTETTATSIETTTTETTSASTTTTKVTTSTTTTESSTQTTTTETTQTTESTTTEPIPGSATWSIGMVQGAPGTYVEVPITITGDSGIVDFLFSLINDELPWDSYTAGDAYPDFGLTFDPEAMTFGGRAPESVNVTASDGSVVLYLTYYIPEDAPNGTVYDLKFNGDVLAYDENGIPLDITEENGWIRVVAEEVVVTGYDYEIQGQYQFYFSHDPREFDPDDLVASITRYAILSDGTRGEAEQLYDFSGVSFNGLTPESVFIDTDGAYYVGTLPATLTDEFGTHEFSDVGTAYIAVKGDVTLTGEADAKDAARILTFAAKVGAGVEAYIYSETDPMMELFAYFLGDVNGESEDYGVTDSLGNERSELDAKDSAKILIYAAQEGAGLDPDWALILNEPLPYYTAEIAAAEAAMRENQETPTE